VLGQSASLALVHEPGQQPSPARQAVTLAQEAGQSASLALVHEPGQQPSPARQAVTVSHEAGQSASVAPLQLAGQQPSPPVQVVTVAHEAGQSLSWVLVQPAGQQPSPPVQVRMRCWVQAALQVLALPLSTPMVQASLSTQVVGQLPSHTSGASTLPLPHVVEQSLSWPGAQSAGQQPSPPVQALTTR
jgi:hypothetical protein